MVSFFHVGDYGVLLEVQFKEAGVPKSVADAVKKTIRIRAPNNVVFEKPAGFSTNGADGKIAWLVPKGFLTLSGVWYAQGTVETPSAKITTQYGKFTVYPVLTTEVPT